MYTSGPICSHRGREGRSHKLARIPIPPSELLLQSTRNKNKAGLFFFEYLSRHPSFDIMVKFGPTVGGNGGAEFKSFRERPVEQLDVWYGNGTGDNVNKYTILRGLRIRWAGGEQSRPIGYCPDEEEARVLHTSFDSERNGDDLLESMDIYGSASRVDSLRLVTKDEMDHFEAGGVGGDKCAQPADGRKLYGLYGRAGDDIDKLGAVFDH